MRHPGCPGCMSAARGGPAAGHSEKPRGRLEGDMARNQDQRLDRYNQRIVEALEGMRQEKGKRSRNEEQGGSNASGEQASQHKGDVDQEMSQQDAGASGSGEPRTEARKEKRRNETPEDEDEQAHKWRREELPGVKRGREPDDKAGTKRANTGMR